MSQYRKNQEKSGYYMSHGYKPYRTYGKYEYEDNMRWDGKALHITGKLDWMKNKNTSDVGDLARKHTNLTLVTGVPGSFKKEYIYKMLNKRKKQQTKDYFRQRADEHKNRKRTAWMIKNNLWNRSEDPETIRMFEEYYETCPYNFTNDKGWLSLAQRLKENPDSEFGYGCHVMNFEFTEKTRKQDFSEFVKQVEKEMDPDPIETEESLLLYDEDKKDYVPTVIRHSHEVMPRNLFVIADFTASERKQFISNLKLFQNTHFVRCDFTCEILTDKQAEKDYRQSNSREYTNPMPTEKWNVIMYVDTDTGHTEYKRYHYDLM